MSGDGPEVVETPARRRTDGVGAPVAAAAVELRSVAGDSLVRLTMGQRLGDDGEIAVEIDSQGFQGRQDVWFQAYEIGRFATELRRFQAQGKGPVNLRSMSPEKFMLDFVPFAKRDRAIVTLRLQRHAFWGEPRFAQSLFVAFEWDRAGLEPLIAGVDALVAAFR
jgi:hypothetical protein